MAYSARRFSTFSGGQTGAGTVAKYDGSGTTAEGGDSIATIKSGSAFFFGTNVGVLDAVRLASSGRTSGAGLPIMLVGNDGIEWDVLFDDAGTVKVASVSGGANFGGAGNRGNFNIS